MAGAWKVLLALAVLSLCRLGTTCHNSSHFVRLVNMSLPCHTSEENNSTIRSVRSEWSASRANMPFEDEETQRTMCETPDQAAISLDVIHGVLPRKYQNLGWPKHPWELSQVEKQFLLQMETEDMDLQKNRILQMRIDYPMTCDPRSAESYRTAIMLASMRGLVPLVTLLLDMGSDIHTTRDSSGNTALHLAAGSAIPVLLERGADVRAINYQGQEPLHRHCARVNVRMHREAVYALLEHPDVHVDDVSFRGYLAHKPLGGRTCLMEILQAAQLEQNFARHKNKVDGRKQNRDHEYFRRVFDDLVQNRNASLDVVDHSGESLRDIAKRGETVLFGLGTEKRPLGQYGWFKKAAIGRGVYDGKFSEWDVEESDREVQRVAAASLQAALQAHEAKKRAALAAHQDELQVLRANVTRLRVAESRILEHAAAWSSAFAVATVGVQQAREALEALAADPKQVSERQLEVRYAVEYMEEKIQIDQALQAAIRDEAELTKEMNKIEDLGCCVAVEYTEKEAWLRQVRTLRQEEWNRNQHSAVELTDYSSLLALFRAREAVHAAEAKVRELQQAGSHELWDAELNRARGSVRLSESWVENFANQRPKLPTEEDLGRERRALLLSFQKNPSARLERFFMTFENDKTVANL